ncbi:MAG: hypothetical protein QXH64_04805 [Nitrososphaeria archaeon]
MEKVVLAIRYAKSGRAEMAVMIGLLLLERILLFLKENIVLDLHLKFLLKLVG